MEPVTKNIPALAMRGLVVYPNTTASFDLERMISMRALERAMETDRELFAVTPVSYTHLTLPTNREV